MDHTKLKEMTVTKAKIVEIINQEIGFSKGDSAAIIEDILDEIRTSLAKDKKVKIQSFGTFVVKRKKARPGNVPKTSKKVIIPERNSISFKPSGNIKRLINNDRFNG
ncbi:integration host factor subunit alpha [Wolbachia endosymbiont of Folsomia candida]|uniref:integration host factor subunit alpha n=1 Tax=Wolbachia endosymbiont of Folsomia candida TaxID=169402 RepID=UPI000A9D01E1|nr:integration host factor subunit alpha [Wolbachia endosymbiont of Folsomia candida]APR98160.1 integration host factor subunit alpha [Wolbachia endosymbiont of Folsomia candida]